MARLRYLGISSFEVHADNGKVVYIDPCLTRKINRYCPITVDEIQRADALLVTHKAGDHSSDAMEIMKKTGAVMLTSRDFFYTCERAGIPASQMVRKPTGAVAELAGLKVKVLKTEHGSWSTDQGQAMFDYSLGFILYVRDGVGIYHVGDTSIFGDFALFGRLYKPKVMLCPIGRGTPTGGTDMDPWEAAIATGMVSPEVVVPVHYDPDGQAEFPERFREHLKVEAPNTRLEVLKPGESIEV